MSMPIALLWPARSLSSLPAMGCARGIGCLIGANCVDPTAASRRRFGIAPRVSGGIPVGHRRRRRPMAMASGRARRRRARRRDGWFGAFTLQPPHALLWSAQLCNDGMCDWAPPTRLSTGVVSDGRCAFVRYPRLTRIGESTLCSALPMPTTTRSCTQQSGSGRFRSLSAPGIARAGCARGRVPMLALHAHHECVVSCLRLSRVPSARRIGCGDRSNGRSGAGQADTSKCVLPCFA